MRQTASPQSSLDALDQWGIQFPLLPEDPVGLGPGAYWSLVGAGSSRRLSMRTWLTRRGDALDRRPIDQWGIEFPIPVEQLAAYAQNRRSGCLEAGAFLLGGRTRTVAHTGVWAAILAVVVAGSALAFDAPVSAGATTTHGASTPAPTAGGSPVVIVAPDSAEVATLPSVTEQPSAVSTAIPGPTEAPSFTAEPNVVPTIQDAKDYLVARLGTGVDRRWGLAQSECASLIFEYESGWNPHATNKASGAYGLPQAYPASKLGDWAAAKAAAAETAGDPAAAWLYRAWRDNPVAQAEWGVDYMTDRYGSPCAALAFRNGAGWY